MPHKHERRAVTVLSTDIVGYSRMMALDADATVDAVRYYEDTLRQASDRHSGRVFAYAGDGFLVEFFDVKQAIDCALEIQTELHARNSTTASKNQVWLRSGIHHGEAIVDGNNLHGDVVNIAVRFQESAPVGGVLISDTIKAQAETEQTAKANSIGLLRFKNIPKPIEAFELEVPGASLAAQIDEPFEVDVTAPVSGFGGRSAIAVFPLTNASRSDQYDHVPEGFSDSLTVALSHMRQFPVIDRGSSMALSRTGLSPHTAAARLGARYILWGEFSDHGDQFKISVRLTDGSTGQVLWSDSYLVVQEGMLAAIEEICEIVAATLEGQLEEAETVRARASRLSRNNILELIWRGRWHLNRLTEKDSVVAREMLESAVEQDPENSEALVQLSFWHWIDCWTQRRPKENVETFHALARRATEANPLDSRGHFLLGAAEILFYRPEDALAHFEQSIALNPSHAHALSQVGSCHMLMGNPEAAIPNLESAIRLNSRDYYLFVTIAELACSYCMQGDYERAISLARRSLGLRQSYWHARMTEVTALMRSGDTRRAVQALDALLVRRPDFFDEGYVDWLPFKDKKWNQFFKESLLMAQSIKNGEKTVTPQPPLQTVTKVTA